MKNKLTYLAMLLGVGMITVQSSAQIQKGNIMVGGNISDLNLGLDEGGNFSFLLNPKIAWFIEDGLALGGYLTTGLSTAKDQGTSVTYGIGALGRYYISDPKVNVLRQSRFFLEGTVGIEGDNPATGDNTNGLGIGAGPGWTYFITPNIGLEALLKYNLIVGFGSSVTSNNLRLGIGFQIYLPGSKPKQLKEEIKQ
jgi:hypothetical protein